MGNNINPYEFSYNDDWTEEFGDEGNLESWLMAELSKAFFLARKAKRATMDEQLFEIRLFENLVQLRDDILNRMYRPSRGIAFIVHEPVVREIFAAPFRDRVVHHLLYNGIAEWWDRRLIHDCYSCRVGKGTLFGIKRLAHHIQSATDGYQHDAYSIKMDIQGYFMSLPREGLFERVCWGLERQFPHKGQRYEIYKELWAEIIFDDPTVGVRLRGKEKEWKKLPKSKSLFSQPEGKGIVIGNLSSQLLSNIYLDLLDRFIKFDLKYEHYGRYVDDFYLIVRPEEFEKAKKDIALIDQFLTNLGLTLHPRKTKIQNVKKGTEFLGTVVYPGRIVPGKRVQINYLKALLSVESGVKGLDSVTSYMGILKHINAAKTQSKIFEKVGLEYKI
ncbi:RNA-directed DNA polymerase [Candidatus Saccharibacteria bacterium]|nr:RNA-directed DNA polymerase [Candidatus Saccharibacteria bacterium]